MRAGIPAELRETVQADIPAGLREWFHGVLARSPPPCHPDRPDRLLRELADGGAVHGGDLQGLSLEELREVWPALRTQSDAFLRAVAWAPGARGEATAECAAKRPGPIREAGPGKILCSRPATPSVDCVAAAVDVLVQARARNAAPPSIAMAEAIAVVCKAPAAMVLESGPDSSLPSARAEWLAGASEQTRASLLRGRLLLQELENWKKSGPQYASAVRLWGKLAEAAGAPEWPPDEVVLSALVFAVPRASTLSRYCSHLRSTLRLLQAPLGALADTSSLVKGAMKNPAFAPRFKASATAKQVRDLAAHAREALGDAELADSWVVARHVTLRYGC